MEEISPPLFLSKQAVEWISSASSVCQDHHKIGLAKPISYLVTKITQGSVGWFVYIFFSSISMWGQYENGCAGSLAQRLKLASQAVPRLETPIF